MRVFYFTEQPYPQAWEGKSSLRVNLPNRVCDPRIAADLYHRYYDEYLMCDDLGLNIMLNEHHATSTCLSSVSTIPLAIMARATKRAQLLVLGYMLGNRTDPLRVAEEIATIDVVSRGRLEVGIVKGVPYETAPSNLNPLHIGERFWESHDLVLKALGSHDEPFNWEGKFFHYRQVNVWPRGWQDPHPPIWITTSSRGNAKEIAKRGYVMATMGTGYGTKALYDTYKQTRKEMGAPAPGPDRFAYLGFLAVAANETEARRRAELVAAYPRTSTVVHPPFANPPGLLSVEDSARLLRLGGKMPARTTTKEGKALNPATASIDELMELGLLFCGTPDKVARQIIDFSDHVGGFENLLLMVQAGHLSHDDTVDSMKLLATEVMPQLSEYRYREREQASVAAVG